MGWHPEGQMGHEGLMGWYGGGQASPVYQYYWPLLVKGESRSLSQDILLHVLVVSLAKGGGVCISNLDVSPISKYHTHNNVI